jgi:hypothetical protein
MMFLAAWSAPRPVAPVGSHPLPTVPVSGQPHDTALLSCIVAACLHILQIMMMSHVRMSCRRLGSARAHHKNTRG